MNQHEMKQTMKQTRIRSVQIRLRHYTQKHSVQHKNTNISKQNFKLFLKSGYDVVIPVLFKLQYQNMGVIVLIFKLLFLKVRLPLSQPTRHRKKPPFCFVRALITRSARLSRVKFCVLRMRNTIP